jgi:hypothetical protein
VTAAADRLTQTLQTAQTAQTDQTAHPGTTDTDTAEYGRQS